MSPTQRFVRPIVAVVVLFVILMLVSNWWGDYRAERGGGSPETTSTAEPTATPDPESEGETPSEGEEPSDTEPVATVVVLVDDLNFRAAPSNDAEQIRTLASGTELVYLGTESGWYKVRDSEGNEGYVSAGTQFTRLDQ